LSEPSAVVVNDEHDLAVAPLRQHVGVTRLGVPDDVVRDLPGDAVEVDLASLGALLDDRHRLPEMGSRYLVRALATGGSG
jgi:hypothetical protein